MKTSLSIFLCIFLCNVHFSYQQDCVDDFDRCPQYKSACGQTSISSSCRKTCDDSCSACSNLPQVTNGGNSPSGTNHNGGVVVTYFCNSGFHFLPGSVETNSCTDGNWSSSVAPTCAPVCPSPPVISGFTVVMPAAPFFIGHQLTYKCTDQAATIMVTSPVTCQSNSTWSTLVANCSTEGSCGLPPALQNGGFQPVQAAYAANSVVNYTCNSFYQFIGLPGSESTTCLGGSWTTGNRACLRNCNDTLLNCDFLKIYCDVSAYKEELALKCATTCNTCPVCSTVPLTANLTVTLTGPLSVTTDLWTENATAPFKVRYGVQYSCTAGTISGLFPVNTCINNDTWLFNGDDIPTCVPDCGPVPAIASNGSHAPTGSTFPIGTRVNYTCNPSFTLQGPEFNLCQDSMWSNLTAPQCIPLECGPVPEIASGGSHMPTGSTFLDGTRVNYTCNSPLVLVGPEFNLCQGSTWSNSTAPECKEICSFPPASAELNVTPDRPSYVVGENVTYSCKAGNLFGEPQSAECLAGGMWSITNLNPLSCVVGCLAPPSLTNGNYTPFQTQYSYNTTITYYCANGYIPQGPLDTNITCIEGSGWTTLTSPLECIEGCTFPPASAEFNLTPDRSSYLVGENVTYSCKAGNLFGEPQSAECLAGGVWSITNLNPLSCVIGCLEPPSLTNGNYTPFQTQYSYNTTVTYYCANGYFAQGPLDSTIMCIEGSGWTTLTSPIECIEVNVLFVFDGNDPVDRCTDISSAIGINPVYPPSTINANPSNFKNFIQQRSFGESLALWADASSSDVAVLEHAGVCPPERNVRDFGSMQSTFGTISNASYTCGSNNIITFFNGCNNPIFERMPANSRKNVTLFISHSVTDISGSETILPIFPAIPLVSEMYTMTTLQRNNTNYNATSDYLSQVACGVGQTNCYKFLGSVWDEASEVFSRFRLLFP